jgi:Putative peptidoglycan binding domain
MWEALGHQLAALRERRRYVCSLALAALLGFGCTQLGPLTAGARANGPGSGGGGLTTGTNTNPTCTTTTPTGTTTTPTGTTTTPTGTTTTPTGTTTTPTSTTTTPTGTTTTPTGTTTTPTGTTTSPTCTTTTPTGTTTTPVPAPATIAPGTKINPFAGRGMWIWVLAETDRGSVPAILAGAQRLGIRTLIVKSADGTTEWPQFSRTLVGEAHADHLDVCAWQYVYGLHPILEAKAAAAAVRDGADCLVIDAEVQYQGRYVQAQRYLTELRSLIGAKFPVALAGFPWIDYHPSFPYSVFLGPGGAQYNTPQMYWQDIGVSVQNVYAHTYAYNELYQRPIDPLGQLFDAPPGKQILSFRAVSRAYKARGVSWWDWQSATPSGMADTAARVAAAAGSQAKTTVASLAKGSTGDVVVWAQEHLLAAGYPIAVDGSFGPQTRAAVEDFQLAHRLPVTGTINPKTWAGLLHYAAPAITWAQKGKALSAQVTTATLARARRTRSALTLPVPWSARLPARGNELCGRSAKRSCPLSVGKR